MSEVEQSEQVENTNEVIRNAFDEAIESAKEEDSVKMDMIGAGATFKNVTRLYNQYMIDAGLQVSKEEKEEIITNTLEGADLASEEGFAAAIDALVDSLTGATERSAASIVRSYGKKNKLEIYAKPKSGGGAGRSSFANSYYDFLAGNPTMPRDEANAFVMGEGDYEETSANVQKHASHYLGIWSLVNRIANA
jgi:hypothetical protein